MYLHEYGEWTILCFPNNIIKYCPGHTQSKNRFLCGKKAIGKIWIDSGKPKKIFVFGPNSRTVNGGSLYSVWLSSIPLAIHFVNSAYNIKPL